MSITRFVNTSMLLVALATGAGTPSGLEERTKEGTSLSVSVVSSPAGSPRDIRSHFPYLASREYTNITHDPLAWRSLGEGLEFSRTSVYRTNGGKKELVDIIAAVRIDPEYNVIKVINGYDPSTESCETRTIEEWQRITGAMVLVNSAQYMAEPWGRPCGLVIEGGKFEGPKENKMVRGMLVAEPKTEGVPKADLLDFRYDSFDPDKTPYTEGVQHWPILLNREGNVRVGKTDWQANRTVFAKDQEGKILFFTTEGGFFTLAHFGRFLRDEGKEYKVHTAMNSDGGYEAEMCVRSPMLNYTTYGQFETYGPDRDVSIPNARFQLPGVVAVFPRER